MREYIDPFSIFPCIKNNLPGFDIIESKDVPRYVLPEEIIPGLPWPKEFRDEFNKWSKEFLGTTNIIPKDTIYVMANRYVVMRPESIVKLSNLSV